MLPLYIFIYVTIDQLYKYNKRKKNYNSRPGVDNETGALGSYNIKKTLNRERPHAEVTSIKYK